MLNSAALDIFLGEPVAAKAAGAIQRAGLHGIDAFHNTEVIQSDGAVFQRRFDNPAPAIQPRPVRRDAPVRRGEAGLAQFLLGQGFVVGEVHGVGARAGEGQMQPGKKTRRHRRQRALAVHAFDQI